MHRDRSPNKTRIWRDSALPDLTLMHAIFVSHQFPTHFHDGFVFAMTEAGGADIKNCGVRGQAETKSMLAINPGDPHSACTAHGWDWRYRAFYIDQNAIGCLRDAMAVDDLGFFPAVNIESPPVVERFLELHKLFEAESDKHARLEALYESFGLLFAKHAGQKTVLFDRADRGKVGKAIRYIRDNYFEEINLDMLSRVTQVSKFNLIRMFRRTVGMTPHQYLIQCRVNNAYALLERGVEIDQVAISAGFYDQSALNRYFKRSFAITPGQFVTSLK